MVFSLKKLEKSNTYMFIPGIALGNSLTMYEFVVYSFSVNVITQNFFPHKTPFIGLLLTFTVFAMSGLVRPLGACFFGYLGDHIGRKKMLIWSISLIGISTGAIGLIPTYHSIGNLSVVLLCICRIFQGLALSGEEVGSALYLMEVAPSNKTGFFGSIVTSTIHIGVILAISVVLICNYFLDQFSWSWRIPFLFAIPISLIALVLRIRQSESFEFEEMIKHNLISRLSLNEVVKSHLAKIVFGILSLSLLSTLMYFYVVFLPSYLKMILNLSSIKAELFVIPFFIFSAISVLIVGFTSDKIGHSLPILIACIFTMPGVLLVMKFLTVKSILQCSLAMLIISILVAMLSGSVFAYFKSIFPTNVRYISIGLIFNISMSFFGGITPGTTLLVMHSNHKTLYMLVFIGIMVFLTLTGIQYLKKAYNTSSITLNKLLY
jgi:MFS transporter, MHS family, proline/betaine transporter